MLRAMISVGLISLGDAAVRGGFLAANSSRALSSVSVSCCDGCSGRAFCSPNSGTCYDAKDKYYYTRCPTPPIECCDGCRNSAFCSPSSGSCYDSKDKDYYKSCAAVSAPEQPPRSSQPLECCSGCNGRGFCSPHSGNCYNSKDKAYYQSCGPPAAPKLPTQPTTTPAPAQPQTPLECCDGCKGSPFCSPSSGSCYDSKDKEYYKTCAPPGPAPPPQCCSDCAGKLDFFSPNSGNCYRGKAKEYYMPCPVLNVTSNHKSQCKVGGENWCAAIVPGTDFTLKTCSNVGMRIKALTYNLFWWNLFGIRGGNEGSAGALVRNAAQDEAFDVVGFQECDGPGWIMGDANMTSEEYDYVRWASNTMAFRRKRFEKLASGDGDFVGQDFGHYTYRRGVHWMRLKEIGTGNTLFVMNHHGPLPVNSGGVCGGRATAYNILHSIRAHSKDGDAILLMGDFNAEGHSETVRTFKEYMHHLVVNWVDNFFSNCGGDSLKKIKNLGNGGSDHNAIMTIVEF